MRDEYFPSIRRTEWRVRAVRSLAEALERPGMGDLFDALLVIAMREFCTEKMAERERAVAPLEIHAK